jgi:hypothetical protein
MLGIVDINQITAGAGLYEGLKSGSGTVCTSGDSPRLNALRPYRGYGAINTLENWFNSNYHSLQVSFEKRFRGNSMVNASYTWSRNMSDNGSDRSNAPQYTYDWKNGEYGRAALDRRHIFQVNYVYELPFFRAQEGLKGHLLGGWQISGITQVGSGLPASASTSGVDPGGVGIIGASAAGARPDWLCNPNTNAPHTVAQWFNTGCFADVPQGIVRPGNSGRYIIEGPGSQRWDFSLFKNFQIREGLKLQLRGEAFNVFNHPNPLGFTTAITGSTYGKVTSFHDPRLIQIGAKLAF